MSEHQITATGGGTSLEDGPERRWAPRKSCGYIASITRPTSGTNVSCAIVNMSTTGACLELRNQPSHADADAHLPAYFTLCIRIGLDQTEVDCAIVWRKGTRLGVRFLAAPRETPHSAKSH